MSDLKQYLSQIQPLNVSAMQQAQAHWDNLAKPLRSLGRLEEMVIQLAGITGSARFSELKKSVLIFCADNGVVAEHVTQTDNSVTAAVTENFTKGIATVNALAKICHADVFPIDIGIARDMDCSALLHHKIAYGTKNITIEPAMTPVQCEQAILTGIQIVREKKRTRLSVMYHWRNGHWQYNDFQCCIISFIADTAGTCYRTGCRINKRKTGT